ncbi:MAG: hypothetical protein CMJ78_17345 [Planctomycetaceae bacterium]|nr:hypothetical protein [Planctomycetaceae bacterium]
MFRIRIAIVCLMIAYIACSGPLHSQPTRLSLGIVKDDEYIKSDGVTVSATRSSTPGLWQRNAIVDKSRHQMENVARPKKPLQCFKDGKHYGLKDQQGKVVLPAVYDREIHFADLPRYDPQTAPVYRNDLWGFVDWAGMIVIPPRYEHCGYFSSNGLAHVKIQGKWGYIDKTELFVIPARYLNCGNFNDGLAPACVVANSWGYIDHTGNWVIAPQFESARTFSERRAVVQRNRKWGVINTAGEMVVPAIYENVSRYKRGTAKVYIGDSSGRIDQSGRVVEPLELIQY